MLTVAYMIHFYSLKDSQCIERFLLKDVLFFQFSGPDDNIFVFYTGLGATGLVAFPTGQVLYFLS